jgi:hypothetical protein
MLAKEKVAEQELSRQGRQSKEQGKQEEKRRKRITRIDLGRLVRGKTQEPTQGTVQYPTI